MAVLRCLVFYLCLYILLAQVSPMDAKTTATKKRIAAPISKKVAASNNFKITKGPPAPPAVMKIAPDNNFKTTKGPPALEKVAPDNNFKTTKGPPALEKVAPDNNFKTTKGPPALEKVAPDNNFKTTKGPPALEKVAPDNNFKTTTGPIKITSPITVSQPITNTSQITITSPITVSQPITTSQITISTPKPGLQHHQLGSLLETVLADYDPRLRPRNDQSRFVSIFSDFVPINIIEFDTQQQKFSVMGYFKMDWRDDFLTWTPSMYEDVESMRIPAKTIWIPKLAIAKSYDGHGLVGDQNSDIALIHYLGYVRWFPEGTYSVVCTVTIVFYPFDIQTCTLTYYIADENNSTINLRHGGEVDLSEYIENAEWKLVNLTVERKLEDNKYVVNFHFKVERRGGFAMFTLVVPVLLLAMLSGATFLIPIESGEKCSFSVTIFLAYGIFETVVIDTLPPNSLDISYFIIYLTSLLAISVLLTFYTILQAKVFETMGDKVFKCLSGTNSGSLTWGLFLQKLDTYVFVVFLVLVVGFTSVFLAVMSEKLNIF